MARKVIFKPDGGKLQSVNVRVVGTTSKPIKGIKQSFVLGKGGKITTSSVINQYGIQVGDKTAEIYKGKFIGTTKEFPKYASRIRKVTVGKKTSRFFVDNIGKKGQITLTKSQPQIKMPKAKLLNMGEVGQIVSNVGTNLIISTIKQPTPFIIPFTDLSSKEKVSSPIVQNFKFAQVMPEKNKPPPQFQIQTQKITQEEKNPPTTILEYYNPTRGETPPPPPPVIFNFIPSEPKEPYVPIETPGVFGSVSGKRGRRGRTSRTIKYLPTLRAAAYDIKAKGSRSVLKKRTFSGFETRGVL